ncbi:adenylate/guanylate cyclase domain-containing protein [Mycobacterium deserti]|uniref:Adenylate/guanylate cyclase domain-containing protein n=1 Tax=Mycobacterium deserti TaxID=2978347 RepID=A0ABT2MET8_9MYCO|nr:adenylate/guanylate cyclase domain-containing protein [Mycobacterium deserti]MCT7660757.1 adenylate/guanylate cyclase domain-containing protein [Mycobacterium deserti]
MTVALSFAVLLETAGLIALAVVLIVSRRKLASARAALTRQHRGDDEPRRRRKPLGVAPMAVKTVVNTVQSADAILRRGIGGSVRSSIEDLAGWARVERPDLARITADGNVVLVFSDIEGSTARNESLGDRGWVKVLERHNELIERRVADHRGYVVKNQGDGFMIAFAEPGDAVRCCVAVQRALLQDPQRWDGFRVRMGAHVGTSVRRGDDLFGLDVALTARIAGLADGGQILVSDALRTSVHELDDIGFEAPRHVELKGFRDAQTVYAVAFSGGL